MTNLDDVVCWARQTLASPASNRASVPIARQVETVADLIAESDFVGESDGS
jgi:hypothetical protein